MTKPTTIAVDQLWRHTKGARYRVAVVGNPGIVDIELERQGVKAPLYPWNSRSLLANDGIWVYEGMAQTQVTAATTQTNTSPEQTPVVVTKPKRRQVSTNGRDWTDYDRLDGEFTYESYKFKR